ncbi:hypothetical protein B484DRAFT_464399 [Ochromonadaceae sp. CCMP2298]|nr:hypothetical protein B484DRAFT_464399 [Ochromonadaceae sp. CCMP2298]
MCVGENFTDFQVAVCDEAAGMLSMAPTLASLFRQLNNLERNKKLGNKGKHTAERRRPHEQEKVPARAFMASATPSPAQRGKPVSSARINKYASKPALSTGTFCTPAAPRGQSNPPPAGLICHNCNKPGHKSKDCTRPAATCSHCDNKWHLDMHCRKMKSERAQKSRDSGSKYFKPPSAHLASCPIPPYMSRTIDSDEDSAGDFVEMEFSGASAYPAEVNLGAFYESDTPELDSSNESTGSYTYESDAPDFDESVTTESVSSEGMPSLTDASSVPGSSIRDGNSIMTAEEWHQAFFLDDGFQHIRVRVAERDRVSAAQQQERDIFAQSSEEEQADAFTEPADSDIVEVVPVITNESVLIDRDDLFWTPSDEESTGQRPIPELIPSPPAALSHADMLHKMLNRYKEESGKHLAPDCVWTRDDGELVMSAAHLGELAIEEGMHSESVYRELHDLFELFSDFQAIGETVGFDTQDGEHFLVPELLQFKRDVCALCKESFKMFAHWHITVGSTFKFSAARALIELQLALIVIVAKPLVEATYLLEGDGATSLIAYDQIMRIDRWFRTHMPNMTFPGLDLAIGAHALFLVSIQHQHGGDVAAAMQAVV